MTRTRAAGAGLALVTALAALIALAAPRADAHPLGNFTVNRLDVVSVTRDRVDVRWLLDQAEIPTFRERGLAPAAVLARKRAAALRDLRVEVDGKALALRAAGAGQIAFPRGQGGLPTTRVELALTAPLAAPARRVTVRERDGAGSVIGWRAIVVAPGAGTAVRSSVPARDVTRGLRSYPRDLLDDPARITTARLTVAAGDGTVTAPRARGADLQTTSDRSGDGGFAGLLASAAAGRGVLVLLLLAAAGWGALHALSPGHGKAMVAAYLVGTRGSARDAVALGLTVTVTHTIGVFALGGVALGLSHWIVPEDLYPWLTLTSGLLVVAVGAAVLRGRARRHEQGHHHGHGHGHGHAHDHGAALPRRSLLALGASAGLIPCPSALVVLLGAVAQHEIALGLLLIVAFSAGLATTLTVLGLVVVRASALLARATARAGRARALAAHLPAASAAAILVVGVVLTVDAAGQVLA